MRVECSFRPAGHYVIIRPQKIQKRTRSGIEIPELEENRLKMRGNREYGHIVAVGPLAWKAFRTVGDDGVLRDGEPWANIGDKVLFSRFAGRMYPDPKTGAEFYIAHDEDVVCVIEEEPFDTEIDVSDDEEIIEVNYND